MPSFFENILKIDLEIIGYFSSVRTDIGVDFFMFISGVGHVFTVLILGIFFGFIFKRAGFSSATRVIISNIILVGLTTLFIKILVNRSRPSDIFYVYKEILPAFPSAHSALTLSLFSLVIFFILKTNARIQVKILSVIMSVAIIFLVGLSRVYLGVHYTSDILGGYLAAFLWLIVTIYFYSKYLRNHSLK
jgi:undecaprenyl-diphosphatase